MKRFEATNEILQSPFYGQTAIKIVADVEGKLHFSLRGDGEPIIQPFEATSLDEGMRVLEQRCEELLK